LLPKGLVEIATEAAVKEAEHLRKLRAEEEAKERKKLEKLAEKIRGFSVEIKSKASKEGKLFGSVTSSDIAKAIKEKSEVEIDKGMVILEEPIKQVGEYKIKVKLTEDINVDINVKVIS
jgi:large subunit ribosomal protein L9